MSEFNFENYFDNFFNYTEGIEGGRVVVVLKVEKGDGGVTNHVLKLIGFIIFSG